MQNQRLLFSLIIKLLVLSGLLLLVIVFFNSLFVNDNSARVITNAKTPEVIVDLAEMQIGQIRKTRWDNKEVAVLFRQFPEKLISNSMIPSNEKLHESIDAKTRSINNEYFVYINSGDSRNCPLYYSGGEFKDVCSANKFDESGRALNFSSHNYFLLIPPHYFDEDKLIIGKWQS